MAVIIPYRVVENIAETRLYKSRCRRQRQNVDDMPPHYKIKQQRGHKAAHRKDNAVHTEKRSLRCIEHKSCDTAEYCRIERVFKNRNAYRRRYDEKRHSVRRTHCSHNDIFDKEQQKIYCPAKHRAELFLAPFDIYVQSAAPLLIGLFLTLKVRNNEYRGHGEWVGGRLYKGIF